MSDTRGSKLFKPFPEYQQHIIDELGIPTEKSTLKEIIKREKIYVQKMNSARLRMEDEFKNNEVKRKLVFNGEKNDGNRDDIFGQIKTFKSFKEYILSQKILDKNASCNASCASK